MSLIDSKMDIFKEVIKGLTPLLKHKGFAKKVNSFFIDLDKNYGVINFQKSKESNNEKIKLTINFGIYSDVLGQSEYGDKNSIQKVEECHWRARIGDFMLGKPDFWWKISLSDNLEVLISSIKNNLENIILPEIEKRLTNENLINSWMNDPFAGTTEIGRFKYLSTLLKDTGDLSRLNEIIEKFIEHSKGKLNFALAVEHLKTIEYTEVLDQIRKTP
jgi:hypothetical protein